MTVVDASTDHVTIEAELSRAAVLLITDAWSPGWKVVDAADGPQDEYRLLPANHALRAVALAEGYHRIRIEYRPGSLRIGAAVSGAGLLAVLGTAVFFVVRRRSLR